MQMFKYIGKRVLLMLPTIFLMSVLSFFIIQLPPGDFISAYIARASVQGEIFTDEMVQMMRAQYGLDKPWFIQYFYWIGGIITRGDWGYSFQYQQPVGLVIMNTFWLTIIFSMITTAITYAISIPVGIFSATHQYSLADYIFTFIGFIGMAAPNFLLAIIFMYAAYTWTGNAYVGLFNQDMLLNGVNWGNLGEFLKRCIMPVLIIALSGTCGGIRSMRALMLDELAQPYTLTARAKGVSERKITMKYCFRSALNPTVSGFAGMLSSFFTGSTITAIVMNLSLQGPVLYGALQNQDMYLAGTILFIQSLLVVLGTLLSDIALGWLDPKIRLEYTGG